jgi:hypothetical protein
MRPSLVQTSSLLLCALLISLSSFCTDVSNPGDDPQNVTVSISADSTRYELQDSVRLIVGLGFPEQVDSLRIAYDEATSPDSMVRQIDNSISFQHQYQEAGTRSIKVTAYLRNNCGTKTASVNVIIGRKPALQNEKKPRLSTPTPTLGSSLTIVVEALGSDTLRYEWYRGTTLLTGSNNDTQSFAALSFADSGLYHCIVKNGFGADTSAICTVKVTAVQDTIAPRIRLLDSTLDSAVLGTDYKKIETVITDNRSISRVRYSIGTDTFPVTAFDDSVYYATVTGLTPNLFTKVTVSAWDSAGRQGEMDLHLKYAPPIGAITLFTPANESAEVGLKPAFTWSRPKDHDGDSMTYKVWIGTSATALTTGINAGSDTTVSLTNALSGNARIYWKVTAYTEDIPQDSVNSEIQSFVTFNARPTATLASPINGRNKVLKAQDKLLYSATDPDGGPLSYTLVVGTDSAALFSSTVRKTGLSLTEYELANFTSLTSGTKYFWTVIATDNGLAAAKSDTAAIESFWTKNEAPVWGALPTAHDTDYYRISWDLSKYCTPTAGHELKFVVVSGGSRDAMRGAGDTLQFTADSQAITVKAIDSTISGDVVEAEESFQAFWYVDSGMKRIPAGRNVDMLYPFSAKAPFYIDSTEVTQEHFLKVMGFNPSQYSGSKKPVETVTCYDAILYCNKMNKLHGFDTCFTYSSAHYRDSGNCDGMSDIIHNTVSIGYDLPDYQRWGYAYTTTHNPSYSPGADSTETSEKIWWIGNQDNPYSGPKEVALKASNYFNLYDMAGNVYEWIYYNNASAFSLNPIGGSWMDSYLSIVGPPLQRIVFNGALPAWADLGFRLIRINE